jgi:hypothetical protein
MKRIRLKILERHLRKRRIESEKSEVEKKEGVTDGNI